MITLTLTEEEYSMLIQMLIQSNPIIQKIAAQANPQIAQRTEAKNENTTDSSNSGPSPRPKLAEREVRR